MLNLFRVIKQRKANKERLRRRMERVTQVRFKQVSRPSIDDELHTALKKAVGQK